MVKQIVVLGMHRAGTSLVANLLIELGVNMGIDLLEPDDYNPRGYFEDTDFLRLNKQILFSAGGAWDSPPKRSSVRAKLNEYAVKIQYVIDYKNDQGFETWGWKDPRTSLIPFVYHPYLNDPGYIVIERNRGDIIRSMMQRDLQPDSGNMPVDVYCQHLINVYYTRIYNFIKRYEPKVFYVDYENLVESFWGARQLLENMTLWGNLEPLKIGKAMEVIKFK